MKKYIISLLDPIPKSDKSHVRGWALYWARMLDAEVYRGDFSDIKQDDICYIDHGVNYTGSIQSFGGIPNAKAQKLVNLSKSGAKLISLDIIMPDYIYRLKKWQQTPACSKLLTNEVIEDLDSMIVKDEVVTWKDFKTPWITIGDSHSIAFARKNSTIIRTNGKTLHGFLNSDWLDTNINDIIYPELKGITFCFGSIDIRHHLMRQPNPKEATISLVTEYANLLHKINTNYHIDVEAAAPVPIEHEARKIPNGGMFKKTGFYGDLHCRKALNNIFVETLIKEKIDVVSPPSDWYIIDPEMYAKEHMELNSSVHIAPKYYRSNNWGESKLTTGLEQFYV